MKYPEYKQLDLPKTGKDILEFWKENRIFEKSVSSRPAEKPYTFYEGPPSANGMPGIHHVMARSIKDIFCRYKTLKGYRVERKGGWDTHGLPIELAVEKALGITKDDIGKKISIEDYNAACRREVMKYTDIWNDLTTKMGYWVDLENPYVTYKNEYIESLWWILKQLHEKGFLYKGYTVQPYSPAAGTGLSSHELNQPGTYKMLKDTSITAEFRLKKDQQHPLIATLFSAQNEDTSIIAWTTTPWTLPSNCALAVGEKIRYVKVKTFNPYTYLPVSVVLAKDLVPKHFKNEAQDASFTDYNPGDKLVPWKVEAEFSGADLVGLRYHQLMEYVTNEDLEKNAFRVIPADFVTTEDGTGIVHTASIFGADDFRAARENGVPSVMVSDEKGNESPLVDKQGRFVNEVTDFAGRFVKEEYYPDEVRKQADFKPTDVLIAIKLKEDNKAFKVEKYEHSYPHCWRTDKPVLYYPLDSWFIRTTDIKDKLVSLNKTINWKPESTGTGRFGNWLENLVDWNLSRSRYWGTPLPIWRTKEWTPEFSGQEICIGSMGELYNLDSFDNGLNNPNKKKIFKSYYADLERLKLDMLENSQDIKEIIYHGVDISSFQDLAKRGELSLDNYFEFLRQKVNKDFIDDFTKKYAIEDFENIDLHRPYVDYVYIVQRTYLYSPDYNHVPDITPVVTIYTRESDLIDVWFDSGAMPYAQWHYPFENAEKFEHAYPADFIAEGVDQTRGWFFTLHTIAALLSETSDEIKAVNERIGNKGIAFKNVVSNGLVLDRNGNKMSKRLGNAVDPFETIEKYSADASRWYMISNASPWDNLKFNLEGLDEVRRKFFGTLYNTYAFFALYANIDGFTYSEADFAIEKRPELDRWVLSLLNSLTKNVDEFYADFEPTKATRAIQEFVDEHLSNWYVRLGRRRFWKSENSEDKLSAYQTLYTCLLTISKLMSPVAPFFADQLFLDLNKTTQKEQVESVHLAEFPVYHADLVDKGLEERMQLAQEISSMVLSLRKKTSINVRQPLNKILLPVLSSNFHDQVERIQHLILAETNIKHIEFITDTAGIIHKKVKANFKVLGKKVGKDMKAVAEAISGLNQEQIEKFEETGELILGRENGFNTQYALLKSDVEIIAEDVPGWQVAVNGKLTVALDVTITSELKEEGLSRELVNRIQNLRKEQGLAVTDRINVSLSQNPLLAKAVDSNFSYICAEILADKLEFNPAQVNGQTIEINEEELLIAIEKA